MKHSHDKHRPRHSSEFKKRNENRHNLRKSLGKWTRMAVAASVLSTSPALADPIKNISLQEGTKIESAEKEKAKVWVSKEIFNKHSPEREARKQQVREIVNDPKLKRTVFEGLLLTSVKISESLWKKKDHTNGVEIQRPEGASTLLTLRNRPNYHANSFKVIYNGYVCEMAARHTFPEDPKKDGWSYAEKGYVGDVAARCLGKATGRENLPHVTKRTTASLVGELGTTVSEGQKYEGDKVVDTAPYSGELFATSTIDTFYSFDDPDVQFAKLYHGLDFKKFREAGGVCKVLPVQRPEEDVRLGADGKPLHGPDGTPLTIYKRDIFNMYRSGSSEMIVGDDGELDEVVGVQSVDIVVGGTIDIHMMCSSGPEQMWAALDEALKNSPKQIVASK